MRSHGLEKRLEAHIVNYADDLVICCRGHAEQAVPRIRDIVTKPKLTVNETKTRVCKLPEEKFGFRGVWKRTHAGASEAPADGRTGNR